ncbi:MAG: hypothetical protein AABY22_09730 [Nanoarchaeota archaeon]
MGDRYLLTVLCNCGFKEEDVWYAPTSGVIEWRCPICHKIINLEEYSGIDAEDCASTDYGLESVRKLKKEVKKLVGKELKND